MNPVIAKLHEAQLRKDLPEFRPGDTVRVNVRLKEGEGLVGMVAETAEAVNLSDAPADPHFSYRPETGEDPFKAFLGVPIVRGGQVFGVLTVQNKATGEVRRICDMGQGGSSGKWADLARFRVPPLRGLAARAPYFHDGRAEDISKVIHFYKDRFNIDFSDGKDGDLEAFLGAL